MPDAAIADLSFAIQTAKGAAAASPTYKVRLAGGGLGPARGVDLLSTTDDHGFPTRVDAVGRYVYGEFEIYARPEAIGPLLYGALGAKSVSGAGTFTHTFVSAAARPWFTFWRMVGNGTVIEQFIDCRISKLRIESRAGQPVKLGVTVLGREARRRSTNPSTTILTTDPFMHWHGKGTLQVDATVIAAIREIDVEIDNNDSARPGGLGEGFDVVGGGGRRAVMRTVQKVTSAARYDLFHYGSTTPADNTLAAQDPATGSADFRWVLSASRELRIEIPAATPASFEGYEADPEHGPMIETRTYLARFGGSISAVRATLKNAVASY